MLTVEQIRETVAGYFKDKPVKEVYLFGSYADGSAKESSDVDILFSLSGQEKLNYFGLAQYLIDLEKLLAKKVDLVQSAFIYPSIKKEIEKNKILLYSK